MSNQTMITFKEAMQYDKVLYYNGALKKLQILIYLLNFFGTAELEIMAVLEKHYNCGADFWQ